ncbi:hypothetical protein Ahy_B03g062196 isoform D [Arachis hypogaea]|uniref:Uncharacterized protein n=1 Tax=Arachis hypogaea TaxID=3818 RepID=A0A444ZTQ4_ARAHY|nr:hypothetical protein Ahy_B03g062196 isoform D [Arachis hypogaea]
MLVDTSAPRQLLLPLAKDKTQNPRMDRQEKDETILRAVHTSPHSSGNSGFQGASFSTKSLHAPPACDACPRPLANERIESFESKIIYWKDFIIALKHHTNKAGMDLSPIKSAKKEHAKLQRTCDISTSQSY